MEYYTNTNNHFYVKFFLLDDSTSLNGWGVSRQALAQNMRTFIGKPFIIMPKFGHPTPDNGDEMFAAQEPYRVGTIIETGVDRTTGKAWGVAEITDEKAKDLIKSGEIKFVSPSIVFHAQDMMTTVNGEVINSFIGAHVAGVKDPAFGMTKAMIKGQCSGDNHTCRSQLMTVQASIEKSISSCGCMDVWRDADKSPCLQKCFHDKKKVGLDVTDPQNIAICMSECSVKKTKQADTSDKCNICNGTKTLHGDYVDHVFTSNTSIKDKNEKINNNMTEQTIESLSAKIDQLTTKIADWQKDDQDTTDSDQKKSKQKIFKNRGAGQNDPSKQNDTGSNDYDDDDQNDSVDSRGTPGSSDEGTDNTDQHQTTSKNKQKPSKTIAAELTEKLDRMEKQPIVDSILEAKEGLNLITTETRGKESDRLFKQSVDDLKLAQAELKILASAKKETQPYVRYSSGALNNKGQLETADAFISEAIFG